MQANRGDVSATASNSTEATRRGCRIIGGDHWRAGAGAGRRRVKSKLHAEDWLGGEGVGRATAGGAPSLERQTLLRDGRAQSGTADQDRAVSRHAARRAAGGVRRGVVSPA